MADKSSKLNTQAVLAMKGAGYYSAHQGAKHAIDKVRPMLEDALPCCQSSFTLADFGATNGGTSQRCGLANRNPTR